MPAVSASPRSALARSPAFREALLRAEEGRAWAVIAVVGCIAVPLGMLGSARSLPEHLLIVGVFGALTLLVVQLIAIAAARWARRHDRPMPVWFSTLGVILESIFPSAIVLTHVQLGTLPKYATLSAPVILVYPLLICLTTLRMRPMLCALAGTVSAASFAGVAAHVVFALSIQPPEGALPRSTLLATPIQLLFTGLAAAWVSHRLRASVEAALGEAQTRARLDRDLAVAQTIQRALLPRAAPEIPGFDIAGWNRPADQTGGDYFDWHELPDGRWLITLADVSGHGVGPALVTAACRAYVRALGPHQPSLEALAAQLNALLCADLPDGRFVTMAGVIVGRRDEPVLLLSAGHAPIVVYTRATGQTRDITPHAVPLAITPDMDFGPAEAIPLEPGDALSLVTDGFVEWARPGDAGQREQFGSERLHQSLKRHAQLTAQDMIAGVAADVGTFAGGHAQQDDLTMVVIKRREA